MIVGVVGAGAWGQALATHLDRAGHQAWLWARDPSRLFVSKRRSRRLPGVTLNDTISIVPEPQAADTVLVAVPVASLRAQLLRVKGNAPLVLCCKGMETGTGALPLEVASEVWPRRAAAVLSGPNFAHEVAAGLPAASIVAASDERLAVERGAQLGTDSFRLYSSTDPVGAGLGGAAKNVVAIAAGAAIGAGLGENARAALITRGLSEIARLAEASGGQARTVAGLSGAGDLVLTCTGRTSRNFSLGEQLGRGMRLDHILAMRDGVTEGVATAPALVDRASRAGIELPIAAAVSDLLAGTIGIAEATWRLLARPARGE